MSKSDPKGNDFLQSLLNVRNTSEDPPEPDDDGPDGTHAAVTSGEVVDTKDIVYYVAGEALVPGPRVSPNYLEKLPVGTYLVSFDIKIGLHLVPTDTLDVPPKVYGSINRMADRIISTFNDRDAATGVLLAGEKGSGKSLLTKLVSHKLREAGVSTLLVTAPFCGGDFNRFMQQLNIPAVVIFDEFEKVYNEEKQQHLLTLLDGLFPTKKLFMLTCNDKWRVDKNMKNRPGRLFYNVEFRGMTDEDITEYCNAELKNKANLESVVKFATSFYTFNFDMLKALVQEMNRYDEPAAEAFKLLNVKPETGSGRSTAYKMAVVNAAGKRVTNPSLLWHGEPFKETGDPDDFDDDAVNASCYDPEHLDDRGQREAHYNVLFTREHLVREKCLKGKIVCFDPESKHTLTLTPARERAPIYDHMF